MDPTYNICCNPLVIINITAMKNPVGLVRKSETVTVPTPTKVAKMHNKAEKENLLPKNADSIPHTNGAKSNLVT